MESSQAQDAATSEPPAVSLMWPRGASHESGRAQPLGPDAVADLQVAESIRVLASGEGRPARRDRRERLVRQALHDLCADPDTIAYRQEVVAELLHNVPLRERLNAILPDLEALAETNPTNRFQVADDGAVQRIARQLGDLELFVDVARGLERALDGGPLQAAALTDLRAYVQSIASTPAFLALEAELPALRATLAQAKSVTVGINLTPDLAPESATILTLSEDRIEGARTLLGRLLGGHEAARGITPLQRTGGTGFGGQPNRLTRDLNALLEEVAAPVGRALDRYAAVPIDGLVGIGPELSLLLNGALLVERLARAGLPMCRPEIAPPEDRVTLLEDGYDLSLALRLYRQDGTLAVDPRRASATGDRVAEIVPNVMTFDDASARVWILTGPNGAGKTTYTRAVGLAQIMFQAGLYVPARAARLSPVDAIYTHFPSLEQAHLGMGRLDEEAERLAAIFKRATSQSLVLLNETLAGTAASEAEGLARDAVRGLRLLGARAVYVTHLHELAASVDHLNATTPGTSLVGSLVADADDPDDASAGSSDAVGPAAPVSPARSARPDGRGVDLHHRRTFRIHPGLPRGQSYASDIARRYGISFPQLVVLLRERGLAPPPAPSDTGTSPDATTR